MSTSHAASEPPQRVCLLASTPPSIDAAHLSPAMCFLRSQIQVFTATQTDIDERRRIGGTASPPNLGRVGLRCKWCCDPTGGGNGGNTSGGVSTYLPPDQRSKGAVTYPKSIRIIHQSVRNFQRYHFFTCPNISEDVREEFRRRQKHKASSSISGGDISGGSKSVSGGKEYWITSCQDMGLVDVIHDGGKVKGGGGEGIRFADDERMVEATAMAERELLGLGGDDGADGTTKKKKRKRKPKSQKSGAVAAYAVQDTEMPPLPQLQQQMPPQQQSMLGGQMPSLPPPAAVDLAQLQQHQMMMSGLPPVAATVSLNSAGSSALGLGLGLGLGSLAGQLGLGLGGLATGGGPSSLLSVPASASPSASARGTPLPIQSTDPNAAATAAAALLGTSGIGGGIGIGTGQDGAVANISAEQLLLQQQHRQLEIQQQQIAQRMLDLQMRAMRASSAALSSTSSAIAVSEGRPSSASATETASLNDAGGVLENKLYLLQFVDSVLMVTSALGLAYNGTGIEANRCGILGDAVDMDTSGAFSLDSAIGLLTNRALTVAPTDFVGKADSSVREKSIRSDLMALGRILCRHLATSPLAIAAKERRSSLATSVGGGEDEASCSSAGSNKRQKMDHLSVAHLRDLGFPPSLCILISKLLDVSDTFFGGSDSSKGSHNSATRLGRYRDVFQVEKDLLLIKRRPDEYLVFGRGNIYGSVPNLSGSPQRNQLESSPSGGYLCGREMEMKQLQEAYQRSICQSNSPREIVLISGSSGVGKSSLTNEFCSYVKSAGGNCVQCAFDDLLQMQPMSVLLDAFNDHCRNILHGEKDTMERIRAQLKSLMGSKNAHVLGDAMPYLLDLIGGPPIPSSRASDRSDDVEASVASNRFMWFLRLLVRGIASPDHPLCLCLDDLHCASKDVLDLVCALAADGDIGCFFILGCYRDTEIGLGHPLQDAFEDFARNRLAIHNVFLSSLNTEQVNTLVGRLLQMPPESIKDLSDIIYAETGGNALFVHQLLKTLKQEGQLVYLASDRSWSWDAKAIQSRDTITDDCFALMKRKILGLDNNLQSFLKKAACLPDYITFLAASDESISTALLLETAIREGFIAKTPDGFKFTHSLIQSVIYNSIPEEERKLTHLNIGKDLWTHSSVEELEASIYIVVDQLRRGADLVTDPDERAEFAKLFLMAGEKASRISAFPSSCKYFLQGTSMLSEDDWKNDNYELNLRLHTACAEAQNMTGDYEGSFITVNAVIENGKSLKDKLRAYTIMIMSLGSQGKMMQAIEAGIETLSLLGINLPLHPNSDDVNSALRSTRALLVGKSYNDITAFGIMTDDKSIGAMHIMTVLSRYAYVINPKLMNILGCCQVKLTCESGLCKDSCYGLAVFGNCLGHSEGSIAKSLNYGKWALALVDALNVRSMVPRCTTVLSDLFFYIEGSQSRLQSQMMAVEVGLRCGDVESALTCANLYLFTALQTGGRPLDALTDELSRYMKEMTLRKHFAIAVAIPYRQALLNFQNSNLKGDPTNIAPPETGGGGPPARKKRGIVLYREYILQLMLACFFRKWDKAKPIIKKCDEFRKSHVFEAINSQDVEEAFLIGIISAEVIGNCFDEKEDDIDYSQRVLDAIERFEKWAKEGPHFGHRLALLKAEAAFHIDRDHEKAAPLYEEAIRLAEEHSFVHEQALACELHAFFQRAHVDFPKARQIFQVAKKHYGKWGAKAKEADMDFCIDQCDVPLSSLWV